MDRPEIFTLAVEVHNSPPVHDWWLRDLEFTRTFWDGSTCGVYGEHKFTSPIERSKIPWTWDTVLQTQDSSTPVPRHISIVQTLRHRLCRSVQTHRHQCVTNINRRHYYSWSGGSIM